MKQDIIESNRLIAEFMGIEFNKNKDKVNHPLISAPWPPIECLKYHTSWDWLMPVVEKVRKICYELNNDTDKMGDIWRGVHMCDIQVTHKYVVQFLKWHNTQPH